MIFTRRMLAVLLFNFSILTSLFSQNYRKIDSLRHILYTASTEVVKALAIGELISEYMWTKPDTCLYYSKIGLDLISNPTVREKIESSANAFVADFECYLYARSATALSEQRNDSLAVKMGLKALGMAEKSKDTNALRRVYLRLAEVYQNIGEPAIAITYFKKLPAVNPNLIVVRMASIGSCFFDLGEFDSALHYLKKVDLYFEIEPGAPWPVPAHFIGKVYNSKHEYEKAIFYFRTAILNSERSHLPKDLSDAYIGIAEAFQGNGMTDTAILYLKKSLSIANELSLPSQSTAAVTILASIYEKKGLIDSAYKYQKTSMALKDSLQNRERIKQVQNYTFDEILRQQDISEKEKAYKNKIKTYTLTGGLIALFLLALILLRNNKHKQKLNTILLTQKEEIQKTLSDLKSTQSQLIHSEKMASLGELTAGIAHEIQNPLNFVNNFSEVNKELIEELKNEKSKVAGQRDEVLEDQLINDIEQNLEKINQHGKRAGSIVKGMLQHSLSGTGLRELVEINSLGEEYLRLAYHGWKAKDKSFNAATKTEFDKSIGKINIIPAEIGRVILNLINNAFYAVSEKQKQTGDGYEPSVTVTTKKLNDKIEIRVKDNANGIPKKIMDKIFQPFFTTKPTGQGTGLGLSLSYDIIKAHGGSLKVETRESEGSEFIIMLPITS